MLGLPVEGQGRGGRGGRRATRLGSVFAALTAGGASSSAAGGLSAPRGGDPSVQGEPRGAASQQPSPTAAASNALSPRRPPPVPGPTGVATDANSSTAQQLGHLLLQAVAAAERAHRLLYPAMPSYSAEGSPRHSPLSPALGGRGRGSGVEGRRSAFEDAVAASASASAEMPTSQLFAAMDRQERGLPIYPPSVRSAAPDGTWGHHSGHHRVPPPAASSSAGGGPSSGSMGAATESAASLAALLQKQRQRRVHSAYQAVESRWHLTPQRPATGRRRLECTSAEAHNGRSMRRREPPTLTECVTGRPADSCCGSQPDDHQEGTPAADLAASPPSSRRRRCETAAVRNEAAPHDGTVRRDGQLLPAATVEDLCRTVLQRAGDAISLWAVGVGTTKVPGAGREDRSPPKRFATAGPLPPPSVVLAGKPIYEMAVARTTGKWRSTGSLLPPAISHAVEADFGSTACEREVLPSDAHGRPSSSRAPSLTATGGLDGALRMTLQRVLLAEMLQRHNKATTPCPPTVT